MLGTNTINRDEHKKLKKIVTKRLKSYLYNLHISFSMLINGIKESR